MYRLLLRLYPASFRQEYGEEMLAVLVRRRRDAQGVLGVAALWCTALVDTVTSAALVHWDILRQDLRYAVRSVAASPGFTATAVLIASLGIGAVTAAFSIADFVLIRPLPFPDGDRLVDVYEHPPGYTRNELSPPNYRDLKAAATRSFESFAAYRGLSVNLVGASEPQHLGGAAVTADLFPMLGAAPALGRPFTAADDRYGSPGVVLLSYALWQRDFGGEVSVIGRTVQL